MRLLRRLSLAREEREREGQTDAGGVKMSSDQIRHDTPREERVEWKWGGWGKGGKFEESDKMRESQKRGQQRDRGGESKSERGEEKRKRARGRR